MSDWNLKRLANDTYIAPSQEGAVHFLCKLYTEAWERFRPVDIEIVYSSCYDKTDYTHEREEAIP